ncbi:hypothetical protein [Crocosphaera chwakensis]|nr:hypothetical protein [Crocosphaera chwakensis]
MKPGHPKQNKIPILSTVISIFGLIYLLLVLLGQVDEQSSRFQIPEVIIFTIILLLNTQTLNRLSKLVVGKDGITLELNELKKSQNKIQETQEKIQSAQQDQQESISELREILKNFLENNQPLVDKLRQISEVSLADRFLGSQSSSQVLEKDFRETSEEPSSEVLKNTAPSSLSSLLQIAANHPGVVEGLLSQAKKKVKNNSNRGNNIQSLESTSSSTKEKKEDTD